MSSGIWSSEEDDLLRRLARSGRPQAEMKGKWLTVAKVTWAQIGEVTEPGRYRFKFGWLAVTAEDLAVWKYYPAAALTVVPLQPHDGEEYRLGIFDIGDPS